MRRLIRSGTLFLLSCTLILTPFLYPSLAISDELPSGQMTLALLDASGNELVIGTVDFSPTSVTGQRHYQLNIDHHRFTDHFLSMKELKCLEGKELWCRIPYPYANPQTISASDLRWLEHDLLFLFKRANEFGANFWNGIYYQLQLEDDSLRGTARAVDLNRLASPPADQAVPPIGEYDSDEIEPGQRWLPGIIIR
jgi:hypothetical protein